MEQDEELEMEELFGRISQLTNDLLKDGADPAQLAFALTSVATDMGLQINGDPLQVFPVLLGAIAKQASIRVEQEEPDSDEELDFNEDADVPFGATVH